MSANRTLIIRYQTRPRPPKRTAASWKPCSPRWPNSSTDFSYTTYRLADGETFVHIARLDGTDNPLATLPAFADFQRDLAQRCVEQPAPSEATVVGSYAYTG